MILAKLALGAVGTIAVAGAYTFHQGVIRVDVDESRKGGSHVHFWVPAAAVPAAMHFVPDDKLSEAASRAQQWLPLVQAVSSELKKYPEAQFVEVQNAEEHVQISVHDGKLRIDVTDRDEDVHIAVPIATIEDVAENIANRAPRQ